MDLDKQFKKYYDAKKVKEVLALMDESEKARRMGGDERAILNKETKQIEKIMEIKKGSMTKSEYRMVKAFGVVANQKNYKYLVLTPSMDRNWLVFGDNSAVVYAYKLGDKFKKRPNLMVDRDLNDKYKDGVCFVHDMLSLLEKLKLAEVTEWARLEGEVWLFKLPKACTEREMDQLRLLDRKLETEVRGLVMATNTYPDLYGMFRKNMVLIFHKAKKMSRPAQSVLGKDMLRCSEDLSTLYVKAMNGVVEEKVAFTKMWENAVELAGLIGVALECGEMDKKTLARLANLNVDMRVKIREVRKKLEKETKSAGAKMVIERSGAEEKMSAKVAK